MHTARPRLAGEDDRLGTATPAGAEHGLRLISDEGSEFMHDSLNGNGHLVTELGRGIANAYVGIA